MAEETTAPVPQSASTDLPKTMRAWIYTQCGLPPDCLKLSNDTPLPKLPTDTSTLVKVSHVALHPGTIILMRTIPMLFRRPPIIAETDFSGTIVAVGNKVPTASADGYRNFPIGTDVFGSINVSNHIKGNGALAEYLAIETTSIAQKPPTLTFAEASGLAVSASTALALLDAAKLKEGQNILIYAPCGGIGSYFTQLARNAVGPSAKIVGVCTREKWETAKELGCDELLDYRPSPEQTSIISTLTDQFDVNKGLGFDCIIDCYGSQELWYSCAKYLKPGNEHAYVSVGVKFDSYSFYGIMMAVLKMLCNISMPAWLGGVDRAYRQVAAFVNTESLERLRSLCAEGKLETVVGGEWKLDESMKVSRVRL